MTLIAEEFPTVNEVNELKETDVNEIETKSQDDGELNFNVMRFSSLVASIYLGT